MERKSKLEERMEEYKRESKKHIFEVLNITDTTPWQDMTPEEIMSGFRKLLGLTTKDVADKLNAIERPENPVLPWHAQLLETASNVHKMHIDRLMRVLKPRLEELAMDKWAEFTGQSPEAAASNDMATVREKGLRLAGLDRKMLRKGLQVVLAAQEKSARDVAKTTGLPIQVVEKMLAGSEARRKGGAVSTTTFHVTKMARAAGLPERVVTQWLGKPGVRTYTARSDSDITTFHIAKMAEALGIEDIFELEKIGRAEGHREIKGRHTADIGPREDREKK